VPITLPATLFTGILACRSSMLSNSPFNPGRP
jgi:hypothetical protein